MIEATTTGEYKAALSELADQLRFDFGWCQDGVNCVLSQLDIPQLGIMNDWYPRTEVDLPLDEYKVFLRGELVKRVHEFGPLPPVRFNKMMAELGQPPLGSTHRVMHADASCVLDPGCEVCWYTVENAPAS